MPPLRYLFCNYEYPPIGGGEGTISMYLAEALVRQGHEVEVVTAAFGSLSRDARRPRYRIRRVTALRRQAGQSNPVEMISYVASATPYLVARDVLRRSSRPDAIVSFHSIPSGLVGWPLSVLWGVPHFVLFGGGDVPGWLPGELERMHRLTLPLNRAVVYQSAEALANSNGLQALAQKAFPEKPIGILRNAVDGETYREPVVPREQRPVDAPVRLFFAGRLTTQKGVDVLLEALGRLKGESGLPPWRLDVAGTGPKLEEFQAQADRLGLGERVAFLGFLDREAVLAHYQQADVFAFPSRFEGMPCVVLEAMACGLPIASTRIMGIEELVEDGVNGFLVEPDDPGALAGILSRLIGNREERLALGGASRRVAEERWTWSQRARELTELAEGAIQAAS